MCIVRTLCSRSVSEFGKKEWKDQAFASKGGSEQTHDRQGKFFVGFSVRPTTVSVFFYFFSSSSSLLLLIFIFFSLLPSTVVSLFSGFGRKFLTRFLRHRLIINFFTSFSSRRKSKRVCVRVIMWVWERMKESKIEQLLGLSYPNRIELSRRYL